MMIEDWGNISRDVADELRRLRDTEGLTHEEAEPVIRDLITEWKSK